MVKGKEIEQESRSEPDYRQQYRELVEKHKKRIYYLCYDLCGDHHEAEDLSQEVFLKVYKSFEKFRGESRIETWLHRIAVNTWLNTQKSKAFKARKITEHMDEEHTSAAAISVSAVENTDLLDASGHIRLALQQLSPREKSAFVMRHYNDLGIDSIATSLSVSSGTVKSLLFRALKKMQKALAPYARDIGLEEKDEHM